MRAFVILSFIAVASAGRLGYNYQQGASGSNDFASSGSGFNPVLALGGGQGQGQGVSRGSGISIISGNSGLGGGNSGLGGGFGGQIQGSGNSGLGGGYGGQAQGSDISYGISGGSGLGGGIGYGNGQSIGSGINYGSGSSVGGGLGGGAGSNQVIDGGLTKEYFLYSAPEEQAQQGQNTQSISTVLKKNLRVVFIKAPENNGIHNAALQVARQATEDRTAIYVLSKEPDVSEIANQVQEISENVRAKPEVRFIKYRTPEDALNAQRTIQQQYEALGGSSQSSNEGVAPVLNFASPAAAVQHSGHAHHGQGNAVSGGSNLIASGSSISSGISSAPSALNFGSASEQSSQSVDLGSIGSSSSNVAVKSENEYLPPAVKK